MSFKLTTLASAIALALGTASAHAADDDDRFSVRGYATAGGAYSDEDQADFASHILSQSEGVGFSDDFSFDPDSKFGVQLDAKFTSRLSGVVQLVSESTANNSWNGEANKKYRPSLEWANLSYQVTDSLTVRGGRIVLPFQLSSEYRKVGYASHWIRPPVELYGFLTFTSSDGADVSYRSKLGEGFNTVRVNYGTQSTRTAAIKSQVKALGFSDVYENGSLTLRGSYMYVDAKATGGNSLAPFFDPFIALAGSLPDGSGANAAAEAARVSARFDPSRPSYFNFVDAALSYDPGQWFASVEVLGLLTERGAWRPIKAGYITGGYRWRQLTPYATFAFFDIKKLDENGVPLAGLPGPVAAFGAGLNSVISDVFGADSSQQTYSLGLRWDLAPRFALKTQYDLIDPKETGLLLNVQPGFERGSSVNVFSVALDYVF
jgi:hypothetical protein